jgi:hypothetical protein
MHAPTELQPTQAARPGGTQALTLLVFRAAQFISSSTSRSSTGVPSIHMAPGSLRHLQWCTAASS